MNILLCDDNEAEMKKNDIYTGVFLRLRCKNSNISPCVRTQETNLANLITDSMKFATGADMAFLTGGNIRASIEAGNIG